MYKIFFKRFGAYLIDVFLLWFIISILTIALPKSKEYQDAVKEGEKLAEKVIDNIIDNKEIDTPEIEEKGIEVKYAMDKETIHISLIRIVLYIAYFGTYAYNKNGQTIGKKIFKIRIKSNSSTNGSIMFVLRAVVVHCLLLSFVDIVGVCILNSHDYYNLYTLTSTLKLLFFVVTSVVYFISKDKKTLHDLIFKTEVI